MSFMIMFSILGMRDAFSFKTRFWRYVNFSLSLGTFIISTIACIVYTLAILLNNLSINTNTTYHTNTVVVEPLEDDIE